MTEEFGIDVFDIPAPSMESEEVGPQLAKPIRFYGCDSKFKNLAHNGGLQVDIFGKVPATNFALFNKDKVVSGGFILGGTANTLGMKNVKVETCEAVKMREYRGHGTIEYALWMLLHSGRSMPPVVDKKTNERNKFYFGSIDKILFEKSLEKATAYPGKYEIVCTDSFDFAGFALEERPWFRTLIPIVAEEGSGLRVSRQVDRAYEEALCNLDKDNVEAFWTDVKKIKAAQMNRFKLALPTDATIEQDFTAQLVASDQVCDTEAKAERWYNRNIRRVNE